MSDVIDRPGDEPEVKTKKKVTKKKTVKKTEEKRPEPKFVEHTEYAPVTKMSKDITKAATTLGRDEARFLVDAYYQMQRDRIRANNQYKALEKSGEPNAILGWLHGQSGTLEGQVKRALGKYAEAHETGRWSLSISGIGPVLAAGLLAHIDIERAPTVGHIWSFGGLNPEQKWGKGEKRPHNAALKTLLWKIGESFVKVNSNEKDVYGKVYLKRKAYEAELNLAGAYAEQAAAVLKARPTHAQKATYAEGRLPDGHLHARAKRYAVKLFLSAWHEAAFFSRFKTLPPKPYILTKEGHIHYIAPPNMEEIDGWKEAREAASIAGMLI